MLFDTLSLLKAAAYEKLNEKAKIIVDSFLNKSDFLYEQTKFKEMGEFEENESVQYLDEVDDDY